MLVGLCACKSQDTEETKFLSHFIDLAEFPCGGILSTMPLPTKDTISYDILANRFLLPVNTTLMASRHFVMLESIKLLMDIMCWHVKSFTTTMTLESSYIYIMINKTLLHHHY